MRDVRFNAGLGIDTTHGKRIKVLTIEAHTIALATFVDEAEVLVEFNCADVVGADLEFYPNDAVPPRMGKGGHHEFLADAASTVTFENAHAKGATMLKRIRLVGEDIAPTHDGSTVNRDVLCGVVLDAFANEFCDSLQRW